MVRIESLALRMKLVLLLVVVGFIAGCAATLVVADELAVDPDVVGTASTGEVQRSLAAAEGLRNREVAPGEIPEQRIADHAIAIELAPEHLPPLLI